MKKKGDKFKKNYFHYHVTYKIPKTLLDLEERVRYWQTE